MKIDELTDHDMYCSLCTLYRFGGLLVWYYMAIIHQIATTKCNRRVHNNAA